MSGFFVFLGYAWRVGVNLLYLLVVLAVLIGLRDPVTKTIVPILGLIYVTIRTIAIGQGIFLARALTTLGLKIEHIQTMVDGTFEKPDHSEELKQIDRSTAKLYIDGFFLSLIGLICLYFFFTKDDGRY